MLVAEPISTRLAQHYFCLDVVNATFQEPASAGTPPAKSARTLDATLLEIWDTGGLLQTDSAVAQGCTVCLSSPDTTVHGYVSSCVQDEYGFLVEFAVPTTEPWFPASYRPPYLLLAPPTKD
jgi:hypothetical protein